MTQELPTIADEIRAGKWSGLIPEVYALKEVVENSRRWHKNDSVFDHTLRAMDGLDDVLEKAGETVHTYLGQVVGRYSRKDLLYLALLFHDLGKKDTLCVVDGFTNAPDHESVGAKQAVPILARLGLTEDERDHVVALIQNHGATFSIVDPGNDRLEEQIAEIREQYGDVFVEIILLSMADALGSQIGETDPAEFAFRMRTYEGILGRI
ncbi:MAG: HD domain-containing protein [Candidatus Moranbacteria bacterium]|nr:HD domain-containing protein [Candidatus Moranbacteria bacterium]